MISFSLTVTYCSEEQSSFTSPLPFEQPWIATGWHPQKQVTKPYQTRWSGDMGTFNCAQIVAWKHCTHYHRALLLSYFSKRHFCLHNHNFSWSQLKLIKLISKKSPKLHLHCLFDCFVFVYLFVCLYELRILLELPCIALLLLWLLRGMLRTGSAAS